MGLLVISSHVWDSCATINRPGPGLWEAGQDVATPLQGLLLEGFTFATELVNRYENLTPQRLRENQLGRRRASRKLWEEEGPGIRIHSTWGFPPPSLLLSLQPKVEALPSSAHLLTSEGGLVDLGQGVSRPALCP